MLGERSGVCRGGGGRVVLRCGIVGVAGVHGIFCGAGVVGEGLGEVVGGFVLLPFAGGVFGVELVVMVVWLSFLRFGEGSGAVWGIVCPCVCLRLLLLWGLSGSWSCFWPCLGLGGGVEAGVFVSIWESLGVVRIVSPLRLYMPGEEDVAGV